MGNVLACFGFSQKPLYGKNNNKLNDESSLIGNNIDIVFQDLLSQYSDYKINSIAIKDQELLTQYPTIDDTQHHIINIYYNVVSDTVIHIDMKK